MLEKLVIPLMHFILLGFLPIARMRRSSDPAFAAGCGQLFITRRDAYDRSGGHSAIRATLHDGLKLPRALSPGGPADRCLRRDRLAVCRMYRSAGEVWNGLAKNASEGLAAPRLIVPMTVILLGGHVFPSLLLRSALGGLAPSPPELVVGLSTIAMAASYYSRWAAAIRFRQSRLGASCTRWESSSWWRSSGTLSRSNLAGRPSAWKGRLYRPEQAFETSRWESPTP